MCMIARTISRTIAGLLKSLPVFGLILCGHLLLPRPAIALDLVPGKAAGDLRPHLSYHRAGGQSLADAVRAYRDGRFSDRLREVLDGAAYGRDVWAAVDLVNRSAADGRPADRWIPASATELMRTLDIHLLRVDGLTETLLTYAFDRPFNPDQHSIIRLRGAPLELAQGERATLFFRLGFGPVQAVSLTLEPEQVFNAYALTEVIALTAYFAFALATLVFFGGFHLSMRNWVGVWYCLPFALMLVFIANMDGMLFRFFYPESPHWQTPIALILLFSLSGSGFMVAGMSINPAFADAEARQVRDSTKISPAPAHSLMVLAGLSVAGMLAIPFAPPALLGQMSYGLIVLAVLGQVYAAVWWRRHGGKVHDIARGTSVALAVIVSILVVMALTGWGMEAVSIGWIVKGIYVLLATTTMVGLTAHIINLRRQHRAAVRNERQALEAEARRSRDLLEAEKNYSRVRDLAALRQRQLASASHDFKQPLTSMRLLFDAMSEDLAPDVKSRLRETFDYMESLSNDYLRETRPGMEAARIESTREPADTATPDIEAYPLSLILDTVRQMFSEEAASKGLRLKTSASSAMVAVAPIVLMRIVGNLVSNAVKFTRTGTVLIGVRRRNGLAVLQVMDTGPGMTDAEIRAFSKSYQKGETSTGEGLGLAICFELARENGMSLEVRSEPGKGTTFTLEIAMAPDIPA